MTNKEYFRLAEDEANELYFSANGDGYDDDEYFSDDAWDEYADDDWEEFSDDAWDEFGEDEFDSASGHSHTKSTSLPYIIRIANSTASAVSNVIVLDSYTNMADTNNFGNPVAIALSINNPNTSYVQFLRQMASQPFEVGEIYITSTTTAQVIETITVRHQDSDGTRLDKVLTPIRDPFQFQNGAITHQYRHMIDGFTRYTINQILASATLDIYLYPSKKVNPSRIVKGKPSVKRYGNPGVIRRHVTVLKQPKGRGRRMRRLG